MKVTKMKVPDKYGVQNCFKCGNPIKFGDALITFEGESELFGVTVIIGVECSKCKEYVVGVGQTIRKGSEKLVRGALATVYDSDQVVSWEDMKEAPSDKK